MNIITKLKIFSSLLLVCCLFLPLSQCSSSTAPKIGEPQQKVITKTYAFDSTSDIDSWLGLLAFSLPFIISIVSIKNKHKIKLSLAALAISFGALYIVFWATFLSEKILIGGYLAYISTISLIILIPLEIGFNYRNRRQAKEV
jgi:hypothetical protein